MYDRLRISRLGRLEKLIANAIPGRYIVKQ